MRRPLTSAPVIVGSLLALLPIALFLYVGGYFLMSTTFDWEAGFVGQPVRSREFSAEWQCYLYEPAAHVESFVSGREVRLEGYETRPFGQSVVPEIE
jgi:hypothetical protein